MRTCSQCKASKPLAAFYTNGKLANGSPKYRSSCRECEKDRVPKWRMNNREKYNKTAREYVRANRPRINATRKKYIAKHPAVVKAVNQNYRLKNKEKLAGKRREHVEKLMPWYCTYIARRHGFTKAATAQNPEIIESLKLIIQIQRLCKTSKNSANL